MVERVQVGVGCLVLRDNELLMVKRAGSHGAGTWSVPGGHLEFGETPEETACREVREETGVVIGHPRRLGYTNDVMTNEHRHYVTLFVAADYGRGDPAVTEPDKCPWVGWVGPTEFGRLPLFAPLERFIDEHGPIWS